MFRQQLKRKRLPNLPLSSLNPRLSQYLSQYLSLNPNPSLSLSLSLNLNLNLNLSLSLSLSQHLNLNLMPG